MVTLPAYILGPCSAERREQVLETARLLQEACGDTPFIYRAGVWKPRTSPNSFQGRGEEALEWLVEVRERFGVPVATEVATPEHVQAAMKAHIDYLWIGARTSANPIAVQKIAEEMRVQNTVFCQPKAVFIKNPVNADPALWLGNIERLEECGVPVIAVHRGCNHQPCWSMAHTVRTQRPDIPMLIDPSHMSGDANQVPTLLSKIDELGLDGAMIEVHCCPSKALSDAKQQITPSQWQEALKKIRDNTRDNQLTELCWLRAEIDELDDQLWSTIAARMAVSQRIGTWKQAHGITPLQPKRYEQVLAQRQQWARENGLSEELVERLFDVIHQASLDIQQNDHS